MSKMGILKNILKSVLQILKKNCLKIDRYQKLTKGCTARFREIYDQKQFCMTSLNMRTSGKTNSLVPSLLTACTDVSLCDICVHIIAYVRPGLCVKKFIVTQNSVSSKSP